MRAYLSYKFGDDITVVRNLLIENNVDIFDSITDIQYGNSLQQTIKNAIKGCDFLVFIYSKDNPYIAFEAGLAVGTNKPIFSVLAGGKEDTFLMDSTYVHAYPNEHEKIKFSLELFLSKIKTQKSTKFPVKISPHKFYGGGEAIPIKSYFDVVERYNSIQDKSGSNLEIFLQDIFKAYHVNIVKNSNNNYRDKWAPDFSIWSDELTSLLSNPIIIEIKVEINRLNIESLVSNLDYISNNRPTNSALILYDRLSNIEQQDLPNTPNQLFISIPYLVNELQSHGFASSIKRIRNFIIHNI